MHVVVGDYQTSAGGKFHGFIEANGSYTTLDVPGADDTFAQGVNNRDAVVGYFSDDSNKTQGFLESNGAYRTLSVPGAFATFAEGINDEGEVVGYFDDSLGHTHGFVESGGVYTTFDVPGANAGTTEALGINDAGDIVGFDEVTELESVNGMIVAGSTITNGFLATPLATAAPELSTWAMLLIGFAGLGFTGRRLACAPSSPAGRRVRVAAGR